MRKYILLVLIFSLLSNCSHFDIRLRSNDSIINQCLRDFPIGTEKEEVERRLLGYFPKTSDYREFEDEDENVHIIIVKLKMHYYMIIPIQTCVSFTFDKKTNKLIRINAYKNVVS